MDLPLLAKRGAAAPKPACTAFWQAGDGVKTIKVSKREGIVLILGKALRVFGDERNEG